MREVARATSAAPTFVEPAQQISVSGRLRSEDHGFLNVSFI